MQIGSFSSRFTSQDLKRNQLVNGGTINRDMTSGNNEGNY